LSRLTEGRRAFASKRREEFLRNLASEGPNMLYRDRDGFAYSIPVSVYEEVVAESC